MSRTGAYGTLATVQGGEDEAGTSAGTSAGLRSRSTSVQLVGGVAFLVAVTIAAVAVVSQHDGPKQVDLASAPAASDFFGAALQGLESKEFSGYGASGARPRRHKEVSLRTDKHGNVNLNVDIERNGKLVGQETGLKVPVGKTTRLQLALPRKGRLQELDEDVPAPPADASEQPAADQDGESDLEDDDTPVDDDDISELGTAKRSVREAKERVVEDAKRLHDISQAIAEESEKAENAQNYKVAAQEGEEAAKRRAIAEVEQEKEALREAKKRADTEAIQRESQAMQAKVEAAEARTQALSAEAKATAAEQTSELALEKKREALAADAEQEAWDKYQTVR